MGEARRQGTWRAGRVPCKRMAWRRKSEGLWGPRSVQIAGLAQAMSAVAQAETRSTLPVAGLGFSGGVRTDPAPLAVSGLLTSC